MTIYRDDLEDVYKLIEKPENWTQGAYARDAAGEDICDEGVADWKAKSDNAVCWCIYGAAIKANIKYADLDFALANDSLHDFNDTHTHAEVLELIRAGIERAPVRP